jgi:hypothetical protein
MCGGRSARLTQPFSRSGRQDLVGDDLPTEALLAPGWGVKSAVKFARDGDRLSVGELQDVRDRASLKMKHFHQRTASRLCSRIVATTKALPALVSRSAGALCRRPETIARALMAAPRRALELSGPLRYGADRAGPTSFARPEGHYPLLRVRLSRVSAPPSITRPPRRMGTRQRALRAPFAQAPRGVVGGPAG